jgi:excisionase family DNA binding protein
MHTNLTSLSMPPKERPSPRVRFALTRREVADLLGVCKKTLSRWVKERGFPAPYRVSKKAHYFDQIAVEMWLKRQRQA